MHKRPGGPDLRRKRGGEPERDGKSAGEALAYGRPEKIAPDRLHVGGAFFLAWNERALLHRPSSPSTSIVFHVLPGTTFRSVVFELSRKGVTGYPETLVFWGDLLGIDTNIQAGVYEISPEMSPLKILLDLHNGQKYFYRLTVPEGFTMEQVARRMARLGIGSEKKSCHCRLILSS